MAITSGREVTDVAMFCPVCGSAAVQRHPIEGSASCNACSWKGREAELLGVPFKHDFADGDTAIEAFVLELRGLLGRDFTVAIGGLLLRWGFLKQPLDPAQLSRYIVRIAQAVAKAVLEERMEEEKRARGHQQPNG